MTLTSVSLLESCASSGLSFVFVPRHQVVKETLREGVCKDLFLDAAAQSANLHLLHFKVVPARVGGGSCFLFYPESRCELCEGTETACKLSWSKNVPTSIFRLGVRSEVYRPLHTDAEAVESVALMPHPETAKC